MTPAQAHINFEVLLSAGMLRIITVAEPGVHGAGITGTQGIGVNTPSAAAVAAATVGFASDWHIPKGSMLTIGLLSMMLASGTFVITWLTGNTTSELGATPKLHCNVAPMHTWIAIVVSPVKARVRIASSVPSRNCLFVDENTSCYACTLEEMRTQRSVQFYQRAFDCHDGAAFDVDSGAAFAG